MSQKYGSSKDPKYLEKQINTLENYISRMADKMTVAQISEKYTEIDQLQTSLNSLVVPEHLDNIAEWKSRQNGEW